MKHGEDHQRPMTTIWAYRPAVKQPKRHLVKQKRGRSATKIRALRASINVGVDGFHDEKKSHASVKVDMSNVSTTTTTTVKATKSTEKSTPGTTKSTVKSTPGTTKSTKKPTSAEKTAKESAPNRPGLWSRLFRKHDRSNNQQSPAGSALALNVKSPPKTAKNVKWKVNKKDGPSFAGKALRKVKAPWKSKRTSPRKVFCLPA